LEYNLYMNLTKIGENSPFNFVLGACLVATFHVLSFCLLLAIRDHPDPRKLLMIFLQINSVDKLEFKILCLGSSYDVQWRWSHFASLCFAHFDKCPFLLILSFHFDFGWVTHVFSIMITLITKLHVIFLLFFRILIVVFKVFWAPN